MWQIRKLLLFWSSHRKHHDLVSSRSLNSACTKRGMVIQDLESWRAKNFKTTRSFSVDTSLVVNWGENRIFRSLYSHYSCQSLLSVSICYSALALLHPRICLIPLSPSLRDIPLLAPLTASLWLFLVHCRLKRRNISVCVPLCRLLSLWLLSSQCLVGLLSLSSKQRTDLSHNQLQWFSPLPASRHTGTSSFVLWDSWNKNRMCHIYCKAKLTVGKYHLSELLCDGYMTGSHQWDFVKGLRKSLSTRAVKPIHLPPCLTVWLSL